MPYQVIFLQFYEKKALNKGENNQITKYCNTIELAYLVACITMLVGSMK